MQDKLTEHNAPETDETVNELPEMHNLVGFFELLLKIDKREHPELYQHKSQNHD